METSEMASMMSMPTEDHLEQVFHMFAYLIIKHNISMVFDPTDTRIDDSQFVFEDWYASAYGDCKEYLPPNAPQLKGIGFIMRVFIDSDHASELITRRSRMGFIIFINSSPIYWFLRRQT